MFPLSREDVDGVTFPPGASRPLALSKDGLGGAIKIRQGIGRKSEEMEARGGRPRWDW